MELLSLKDKRILITGASSGIGRACAEFAANVGARLILVSRRIEKLEEVRRTLACPERHEILACDLSERSQIVPMLDSAVAHGKLDGLVHSAGIAPMIPVGLTDKVDLQRAFELNYFSFLELMRLCSKAKYGNSGFSVVAVSSVSACAGWRGGAVYCGTKGALSATIRSLAIELASKGIRVNAVCPSNIRTPLYENGATDLNDADALEALLKKQPLGLGEPMQVAAPVCFLLSDAASFITGVNLPVDGGYLAQ